MALRALLNMPCEIHRRTAPTTDDHGNPVEAVAYVDTVDAFIDPAAMSQDAQADGMRHVATSSALGVFPGEAGIEDGDFVTDPDGTRWVVDGRPVKVWSPRLGQRHHVECRLSVAE